MLIDKQHSYSLSSLFLIICLCSSANAEIIAGTSNNDQLHGTNNVDELYGKEGNDEIHANDGNDYIEGNEGDDQLYGGSGDDQLRGGADADLHDGGDGIDYANYITSPAGIQVSLDGAVCSGGDAQGDTLINIENIGGSLFNDTLIGNNVSNTINGQQGDDHIKGMGERDELYGWHGNDQIEGGDGHDYIEGGEGDDQLHGDNDNDQLRGGPGADQLDGGNGIDYVNYYYSPEGIQISLDGSVCSGGDAQGDTLLNIENIGGSLFNDTLIGSDISNFINGQEGNDKIEGHAGIDELYGYKGNDEIHGGDDNDFIDGGEGGDELHGDAGDDQLRGGTGDDIFYFGIADDRDFIVENSDPLSGGIDKLRFTGSITIYQLWFGRLDNDLVIYIINTDDFIRVRDWFSSGPSVERFETAYGDYLLVENIQTLLDAMPTVNPYLMETLLIDQSILDSVVDIITNTWQFYNNDIDNDGVPNSDDLCPETPEGEPADNNGCSATQRDSDGDGFNDAIEEQLGTDPNDPNDSPPDLDNDNIPDALDDDIDGDNIDNDQDAFPNDPTRTQLPAVNDLSVSLQSELEQILINWQAPDVIENIAIYEVYRSVGVNNQASVIASINITDNTEFIDTNIINGEFYRYHVVAVTNNGLVGEIGDQADIFVAYNNTSLEDLNAARAPVSVQLDWSPVSGYRYRLFRAIDSNTMGLLFDVDQNQYLDENVLWNFNYRYQVATLLDFIHPISGEQLTIQGPQSEVVDVIALPPITLNLSDTQPGSDGVLERVVINNADISVNGTYQQAIGPVKVTANSGGQTINTDSSDGSFRLTLPAHNTTLIWAITVSEQTVANRSVSVNVRIVIDGTSPVINLINPPSDTTKEDNITINGTVTDNSGFVANISLKTNRFPDITFAVSRLEGSEFSGELPLLFGPNEITVFAEDPSGNIGQAQTLIKRAIGVAPTIEISSPATGSVITSDRVNVTGQVLTSLEPENIRIVLAEQIFYPQTSTIPEIYDFNFNDVRLTPGVNNIVVTVETTAGNVTGVTSVVFQDEEVDDDQQAPVIQVTHPKQNAYVSDGSIIIAGFVQGSVGPILFSIDGIEIDLIGQGNTEGNFQVIKAIDSVIGEINFNLSASDGNGINTSKTITIIRDPNAPTIVVTTPNLQVHPDINEVKDLPFVLEGTVADDHLAGLSINSTQIQLIPTAVSNTFDFRAVLDLPIGVEREAQILAWDLSGNQSTQDFIFKASPEVGVEIISPLEGDTLLLGDNDNSIEVVARVGQMTEDFTMLAYIDQAAPATMVLDGNMGNADVELDLNNNTHTLIVEIQNTNGEIIAATNRRFLTQKLSDIALQIDRIEPENNARNIEPNTSINLYFNKPIDPALLQIEVRETAHGLTYDTSPPEVTDFPTLENAEPIEVHRNQELVPGKSGVLPGNTVAVFYPDRDIAYSGDVFINVVYDGEELGRYTYKVRSIPTFMQGMVTNQIGQPIAGLQISLPNSSLITQTDPNGGYSFGFGLSAEEALPAGRHRIIYNANRTNPKYGEAIQWGNLQAGRLNRLGVRTVPLLNPDIPFRPIRSKDTDVQLAEGELVLDLSDVELNFENGRDYGDVHVQFTSFEQIGYNVLQSAIPQWLFAVQPIGIEVSGNLHLTIDMPPLMGSLLYVPPNDTYVVMIGLDPDALQLVPVGVGQVKDAKVIADINNLRTLDFLGYAIIDYNAQDLLKQYVAGDINIQTLIRELESKF